MSFDIELNTNSTDYDVCPKEVQNRTDHTAIYSLITDVNKFYDKDQSQWAYMKSPCETTDRDFDSGTAVVRIDIKLLEPLIQIFNFGDYYLDNGMIP